MLWMAVTADKYELPLAVEDTQEKLARRLGITKGGDYNDFIEYNRIGNLILDEVCRLYDEGKLGKNNINEVEK